MRSTIARTLTAAATVAAVALTGGCGSDEGASGGSGSGSGEGDGSALTAGSVSVAVPDGWEKTEPGKDIDAMAELRDGEDTVGRISVRRDFSTASTVKFAAADAARTYIFGSATDKVGDVKLDGAPGDARRNDYPLRESPGGDKLAPKGAMVAGTDIVGTEEEKSFFLVRINYVEGELTAAQVDEIIDSVQVSDG
ncbi:hypothetical protein DSC45_02935 [Streptomyces sp. YIM 130001]|uniref:hypothetical protein n=1 Tax=Streptomyces sp. YIM 130001 TaxID=2259644 RepID=UPI000EC8C651|nr:hypothetical protein [Streptomyces sp. YIM 130001]RII20777.1 hypothetical protein DSC45_02935 [Streptomyces sp. YIM 130001]